MTTACSNLIYDSSSIEDKGPPLHTRLYETAQYLAQWNMYAIESGEQPGCRGVTMSVQPAAAAPSDSTAAPHSEQLQPQSHGMSTDEDNQRYGHKGEATSPPKVAGRKPLCENGFVADSFLHEHHKQTRESRAISPGRRVPQVAAFGEPAD
eukprot:1171856-Pleurochrysis_carterae.AAC.2